MSHRRQAGFALVLVLWSLALLAVLFAHLMAGARAAAGQAHDLVRHMLLEELANSAVDIAAFHLLDRSSQQWPVDGGTHIIAGGARVRVGDEADEVNLNTASADLLRELLVGLDVAPMDAAHLADAIVDWRAADAQGRDTATKLRQYRAAGLRYQPPEQPFRSIDELSLVLGMSGALLERMAPHLTLYSAYGPGPSTADAVVFKALARVRSSAGVLPLERAGAGAQVVRIEVSVSDAHGAAVRCRAVLKLDPAAKERPVRVLDWR
jgi:general secretion pathway protein K